MAFLEKGGELALVYLVFLNSLLPKGSIQGEIIYAPPPPPPFLATRHFSGEGGGGVYFEAPRGRNFIRPPFLYTPHP